MPPPPPVLMDELVEEVLLRLPPDEPAWLVRSSAVCKPWRCILAAPRFRRRYCEFHGTPPVLGFFQENATFVPTSALLPAQPDRPGWVVLDCRHGRALVADSERYYRGESSEFAVFDPLAAHQRRVPFPMDYRLCFSAAVLCATQGCDHHGCQGGHFRVAVLTTDEVEGITSGWLYSSESRIWSEFTPIVDCIFHVAEPSVLVGDILYFNIDGIIKCELGTLRMSMFERPTNVKGRLMTVEDGGLGFAAVVDATNLTLWSMETRPGGDMGWAKLRVIDVKTLLPDGALAIPTLECEISWSPDTLVSGVAEGTEVIFVSTYFSCYMVNLKSGQARKVYCRHGAKLFPYIGFYIPAMEAAFTGQGQ